MYFRRLIFLRNQQFVQTEAKLLRQSAKEAKARRKKKAASAAKAIKAAEQEEQEEARAGSVSEAGPPQATVDEHGAPLRFDLSYLDDHHVATLAALSLSPSVDPRSPNSGRAAGTIVGLGGGALVMCAMRYFPQLRLTVAEIDPDMVAVAKRFFGYETHAHVREVVADGAVLLREQASAARAARAAPDGGQDQEGAAGAGGSGGLDFVIVDADSADPSLGLSAPPKELITDEAIRSMFDCLGPRGLLVMNVAARDDSARVALCRRIEAVFRGEGDQSSTVADAARTHYLFTLRPSEEMVNVIVIAAKGGIVNSEGPDAAPSTGSKKSSSSKTSTAGRRPESTAASFVRDAIGRIERVKAAVIESLVCLLL